MIIYKFQVTDWNDPVC